MLKQDAHAQVAGTTGSSTGTAGTMTAPPSPTVTHTGTLTGTLTGKATGISTETHRPGDSPPGAALPLAGMTHVAKMAASTTEGGRTWVSPSESDKPTTAPACQVGILVHVTGEVQLELHVYAKPCLAHEATAMQALVETFQDLPCQDRQCQVWLPHAPDSNCGD